MGETRGTAVRDWTPPASGSMSTTFQWNDGEEVHYAFGIVRELGRNLEMRFIHYGADFVPLEEAPLCYRVSEASASQVVFDCLEGCQRSLAIFRTSPVTCRAVWSRDDGGGEPMVIEYSRPAMVHP